MQTEIARFNPAMPILSISLANFSGCVQEGKVRPQRLDLRPFGKS